MTDVTEVTSVFTVFCWEMPVEKTVSMCYNTPKKDNRRAAYAAGSVS